LNFLFIFHLELKEELNKVVTSVGKKNKEIQSQIEKLKEETQTRKKKLGLNSNSTEIRLREGKEYYLMKIFGALINDYQQIQEDYQKQYKDRMKRTVKITNPNLTENEIQDLVDNNNITEDAYKKKILTSSQKGTINAYYDEAIETRREILLVEASLMELQDMFIAMAQLVAQQDDLIENIEYNVMGAQDFVAKATENIVVAQQHQEKSKYVLYMIIIGVILFVIAAIILILLAGGVGGGVILGIIFGSK
jgi:t-SNARE complex subunit (syntaxin)